MRGCYSQGTYTDVCLFLNPFYFTSFGKPVAEECIILQVYHNLKLDLLVQFVLYYCNKLCKVITTMATIGQPKDLHDYYGRNVLITYAIVRRETLHWSRTRWLICGISCQKQAKAVHAGIWVGIPVYNSNSKMKSGKNKNININKKKIK